MRQRPIPALLRAVGVVVLAAWAGAACAAPVRSAPAGSGGGKYGSPAAGPYLYVCNQDAASVSVIDMETHELVATVDLRALGFSERAQPHDVAVEPDGSFWYVSLIGDGVVLKFDRENRLVGRAPFETPGMLAVDPDRDRLWVGRSMKAVNPPPRVGQVQRSDMKIEEMEILLPRPHGLALAPGGEHVFVGSMSANQLAQLEAESGEVSLTTMPGPHDLLMHLDISPDGRFLVGTSDHADRMYVLDVSAPDAPRPVAEVTLDGAPWEPAFGHDGRFVYVALKRADAVAVVDVSTWEVVHTIRAEGIAEPQGLVVSPDGRWVYVSNNNTEGGYRPASSGGGDPAGTVVAIESASWTVAEVIGVGRNATGLGAVPPR